MFLSGVIVFVVMCKLPDADKTPDWSWQGTQQTWRHCQWPDGMWDQAWAPIIPHGWPHIDTI